MSFGLAAVSDPGYNDRVMKSGFLEKLIGRLGKIAVRGRFLAVAA
jgi:hypothetical protein